MLPIKKRTKKSTTQIIELLNLKDLLNKDKSYTKKVLWFQPWTKKNNHMKRSGEAKGWWKKKDVVKVHNLGLEREGEGR